MITRAALASGLAAGLLSVLTIAAPASANCGNDKPVGRPADQCPGASQPSSPNLAATPELDSLALMGTGVVGLAGYALTRVRAGRRQSNG